jgi:hypothetical protein
LSSTISGIRARAAGASCSTGETLELTSAYSGQLSFDASGGKFTVADGTHTANIALLGNYLASTFVASSDGHGGTYVVEHTPADHISLLAQPTH